MRILFVCTAYAGHGGIQRFNRNLAQALCDLNAELDIVSVNDPPLPAARSARIHIHGANTGQLRWAAQVLWLLSTRRYDRCICGHVHLAPAFSFLLQVFGYAPQRRILILHGIEVWNRITGVRRRGARAFGRILAVSRYTARSFLEQVSGFPAEAVSIFPNTLSPDLLALEAEAGPPEPTGSNEYATVAGSTAAPCRLLSVTRLARSERDKGILDVLAAVASLPATVSVFYTVVGDGDDRDFLEARARDLGISDRVRFAGPLLDRDLWSVYENTDVFILPSRKEGFGIVFLEAMRFGLPVIGACEKGAMDVIRQNINGLLVRYGDAPAIAVAIMDLAADGALRRRLGDAGQAQVMAGGEFSVEAFHARCRQWILAA
jgi:glycosyltransferase involved in cell wall biosynthesis